MSFSRIVEIAEDGRHLGVHRGFLTVSAEGKEIGRVPLDDIGALVATAHGLSFTNNALLALLERGAPVVLCGPNHSPKGVLWPVDGHHVQAARMRAQIDASLPMTKRLWQTIVAAKIAAQGQTLVSAGREGGTGLAAMAKRVKSGDPDNLEAQAAQRYWRALFGPAFRRDQDGGGANGLLNYGYAILRSGTARATMGAGLHPTLGIHHRNRSNPMCLVDDLMEPFRPIFDLAVARLVDAGSTEVTRDTKQTLVDILYRDHATAAGTTPLMGCLQRLAVSLAQVYLAERRDLDLPGEPLPLFGV